MMATDGRRKYPGDRGKLAPSRSLDLVLPGGGGGDPRASLAKACEEIRSHALLLAVEVNDRVRLEAAIARLRIVLSTTAKQNKRKKPSTFELLKDASRLEYSLT